MLDCAGLSAHEDRDVLDKDTQHAIDLVTGDHDRFCVDGRLEQVVRLEVGLNGLGRGDCSGISKKAVRI